MFLLCSEYEEHLRKTGQQPSHEIFKEIMAGAAGFEVGPSNSEALSCLSTRCLRTQG